MSIWGKTSTGIVCPEGVQDLCPPQQTGKGWCECSSSHLAPVCFGIDFGTEIVHHNFMTPEQEMTLKSVNEETILGVIADTMKKLSLAKQERKNLREMLDSVLIRDPEFESIKIEKKEITDKLNKVKNDLTRPNTEGGRYKEEIKEKNLEIKDLQNMLDADLQIAYAKTGKTELEAGGQKIQIRMKFSVAPGQQTLFE